jgi:hypothetical protein
MAHPSWSPPPKNWNTIWKSASRSGQFSSLGRHRRGQIGFLALIFASLIDVKVSRNKLRFLIIDAIVLLVSIPFIFF